MQILTVCDGDGNTLLLLITAGALFLPSFLHFSTEICARIILSASKRVRIETRMYRMLSDDRFSVNLT